MPEAEKPKETPAVSQPVTVDAAALGESISKGLAKELGPILSRPASERQQEGASLPPPPPLPKEPSYADIMDAIESGDKVKAAGLMEQRDRAREARMDREVIDPLRQQGAHAISEMAGQLGQTYLAKLPTKFRAEAEKEIRDVRNRGVMITGDHWRAAVDIVYGRHSKDIEDEAVETRLRQMKEAPAGVTPGQGASGADEEPETTTLHEEFGPMFREEFKLKARAKGGLTEDGEVAAMNRGIKGARLLDEKGKPIRDYTTKDYLKERREMRAYAELNPSLGLDE